METVKEPSHRQGVVLTSEEKFEEDAAALARALQAEYTVCGQAPMQETAWCL